MGSSAQINQASQVLVAHAAEKAEEPQEASADFAARFLATHAPGIPCVPPSQWPPPSGPSHWYCYLQNQYKEGWYCLLCEAWADEGHVDGRCHRSKACYDDWWIHENYRRRRASTCGGA